MAQICEESWAKHLPHKSSNDEGRSVLDISTDEILFSDAW
jgi:hypothetical protein